MGSLNAITLSFGGHEFETQQRIGGGNYNDNDNYNNSNSDNRHTNDNTGLPKGRLRFSTMN